MGFDPEMSMMVSLDTQVIMKMHKGFFLLSLTLSITLINYLIAKSSKQRNANSAKS